MEAHGPASCWVSLGRPHALSCPDSPPVSRRAGQAPFCSGYSGSLRGPGGLKPNAIRVCPRSCLLGPASGWLQPGSCLPAPGDPDAAVGCSQLDRLGKQHRVGRADEGLCPDTQGGDRWETGGGCAPSGTQLQTAVDPGSTCYQLWGPHWRPAAQPGQQQWLRLRGLEPGQILVFGLPLGKAGHSSE